MIIAVLGIVAPATVLAPPARAQEYADASGHTLTVAGDLRLAGVDGERRWLDGGFGKARFGGTATSDDFRIQPRAVEADIVWQPSIGWSSGVTIAAVAQDGQEHPVDLSESYAYWRRAPHGSFKFAARAGLFWPPVSMEHAGPEWRVAETITPSAIGSWIGEEVKTAGVEAHGSWSLGDGRLTATAALFGFNDTAGTLLAFRGWALHDQKATAFGHQPLPPLNSFMQRAQAPATRPVIELDDRPGYYLKLGWSRGDVMTLNAFYYDNRGDPQAKDADRQWGWRTRFGAIGASMAAGPTRLTAQVLTGRTQMGFPLGGLIWVDTRFTAGYLLVTHAVGRGSISGRVDVFGTQSRGSVIGADEGERGWAATFAARREFGPHVTLLAEALHIDSVRNSRIRIGSTPNQAQTLVQLAIRLRR